MAFSTILGLTEILCSFRLVLEGKKGKEIPITIRVFRFLANNFALSDAEDNTSGPLNWGGITDLSLLRTLLAIRQKSRHPSVLEVMDPFVLLLYASLAASRITSLSELYFRLKRFILLVSTKKVISLNYESRKSSWRWVRLDLILTKRDICINSNLVPSLIQTLIFWHFLQLQAIPPIIKKYVKQVSCFKVSNLTV